MAQLQNLLVLGDSRFLNEINGKIDWSNILSKPTIPAAANNGTLTIQKNGTNVQTFTANQSTNVTANITVPTKVSELTNDSGYTTNTGTVTQVKVGTTAYNPSSGVISLPAYPSVPVSSVAGKTGAVTLTNSDVGLGNVGNFKAVSTVASQGLTDTEQSNARANIGAGTSSLTLGTTSTTALKGDTKYAGASTAGGAATSAAKLTNTSKIGDTNKPVYFTASGVPSAISYTIGKSVPSDAVFTDTTYTIDTGDSNGQIKVTPTGGTAYNVSVKGLGSNAYTSTAYLPLTGGTLTDALTIARTSYTAGQPNPGLILKASNQDVTTNPSSNQWNNSELNFQDKNGVRTGYVNVRQDTDGTMSLYLEASTKNGSTTYYNDLVIAVDKSGNQSYMVRDPAAFRSAIELGTAAVKDVPSSGNASTTQIVMGNDTRLSNARTPTSHTHGNIQNDGTLQTTDVAIANGDKLVVTDSSDSNQIARTSLSFDGSTATQCLTKKGTWATFGTSNLTIGTTSSTAMAGNTTVNHVLQEHTTANLSLALGLTSHAADTTSRTAKIYKNTDLCFNPSIGEFKLKGFMEIFDAKPYIDFHYNNSTWDYTSRIICEQNAHVRFMGRTSSTAAVNATLHAGSYATDSSKYVKKNIQDITDEEAMKILDLRPVSFDYKYINTNDQRGLIAEEVLEVLPNMVILPEDYEGFNPDNPSIIPSIDYSKFVPYLIKMIQIQEKRITMLENKS
jgi:hypothetical protein